MADFNQGTGSEIDRGISAQPSGAPVPYSLPPSPYPLRSGFTLIEVIVVLFFMIVASALVVPRYTGFLRAGQARDAARNLMALVREARETAVETQRPVVLEIDPQNRRMDLFYDDTLLSPDSSPSPVAATAGGTQAQVVGQDGRSRPRPPVYYPEPIQVGMQVSAQTLMNASDTQLTFTPDGRVPDADFLVQYGADRGILVSVRRQGTRVRIDSPDSIDALNQRGP